MAMLNPYAKFLAESDPITVLAATPSQLAEILHPDTIDQARFTHSPAPGKWSIAEILIHLADCELGFSFRMRQVLAEPHHIMQPFDQEIWAQRYAAYDGLAALDLFTHNRRWNIQFLKTVTSAEWERPTTHPERGEGTFRGVIETIAGHDINHMEQIRKLIQAPLPLAK